MYYMPNTDLQSLFKLDSDLHDYHKIVLLNTSFTHPCCIPSKRTVNTIIPFYGKILISIIILKMSVPIRSIMLINLI